MNIESATKSSSPMPAVFIGHGSPMNAVEVHPWTDAWATLAASIQTPRAILAISAHWYTHGTVVTAMAQPRTIHDFGGFPQQLFEIQYPAPGSVELAKRVAEIVRTPSVGMDQQWGLDHGTWSVLTHMYPNADVPVVQLSISTHGTVEQHFALGAALEPLRHEGVLILGSGNVVHNLQMLQWHDQNGTYDWTREFDQDTTRLLTDDPSRAPSLTSNRNFAIAHPSDDHFVPLLYVAGVASAVSNPAERKLTAFFSGYSMGSLSMTSYILN